MIAVKRIGAAEPQCAGVLIADSDTAFAERLCALARFLHIEPAMVRGIDAIESAVETFAGKVMLLINIDDLAAHPPGAIARLAAASERLQVIFVSGPGTAEKQIATHLGEARHLRVTDVIRKPVSDRDLYDLLSGQETWRQAQFRQRGA